MLRYVPSIPKARKFDFNFPTSWLAQIIIYESDLNTIHTSVFRDICVRWRKIAWKLPLFLKISTSIQSIYY